MVIKTNFNNIEYFPIFVLSLKHHDRSQRKMEGQSAVTHIINNPCGTPT